MWRLPRCIAGRTRIAGSGRNGSRRELKTCIAVAAPWGEAASRKAQTCSDYTHVLPEDPANDGFHCDARNFVKAGWASGGISLKATLA